MKKINAALPYRREVSGKTERLDDITCLGGSADRNLSLLQQLTTAEQSEREQASIVVFVSAVQRSSCALYWHGDQSRRDGHQAGRHY